MASYRCAVSGCDGVINAARPADAPCPECAKRVAAVATLREHVRALESQLATFHAAQITRHLPLLQFLAKKPATADEMAKRLDRTNTGLVHTLRQLEKRGLITVASFRRRGDTASGTAVWQVTGLAERLLEATVTASKKKAA